MESIKNKLHLNLNSEIQDYDQYSRDKSPTSVKEVKDIILASSKTFLGKVLSPTKEKYNTVREKVRSFYSILLKNVLLLKALIIIILLQSKSPPRSVQVQQRPVLMTRRQLTDPFGSDDDDDEHLQIVDEKMPQSTPIKSHYSFEVLTKVLKLIASKINCKTKKKSNYTFQNGELSDISNRLSLESHLSPAQIEQQQRFQQVNIKFYNNRL